jgi:Putative ABC exporter
MTRRFLNSFKRAFNNPARTVGTLAVVAMIAATYGGPLFMQYREQPSPSTLSPFIPPLELIRSILTMMIGAYLLFSFALAVDSMQAFTEHDVLNVFPTPLPRKLVFQFLLFTRGLLASTLSILIIAYFFFRTSRSLINIIPRGGSVGSAISGSFTFAALFITANSALLIGGVCCGLAVFHKWLSKKLLWSLIIVVPASFLGGLLYQTFSGMSPGTEALEQILRQSNEQPFAMLLLPVRAIAVSALIPYDGWTNAISVGILIWGGLLVLCQRMLMSFAPSLYDYASHLAQANARRREQRRNQTFNIKAWIGRKGNTRTIGGKQSRWMNVWAPTGGMALFWRNIVMMRRSNIMLVIKANILLSALFYGGIAALRTWKPGIVEDGLIVLGGTAQFFVVFLFVATSVGWLTETLKRFEIQKPLPVSPRNSVFIELLPIAVIVTCSSLVGIIFLIALFPHLSGILLLGFVAISTSYMLMSCLLFIALLFNPDQHDTLQRMLFGFFTIIVIGLGALPSGLTLTLGYLLHFHLIVQGMMVIVINGGCIYALIVLAAKKYESFNPME